MNFYVCYLVFDFVIDMNLYHEFEKTSKNVAWFHYEQNNQMHWIVSGVHCVIYKKKKKKIGKGKEMGYENREKHRIISVAIGIWIFAMIGRNFAEFQFINRKKLNNNGQ